MEVEFPLVALSDLNYLKKSGNQSVLRKIQSLLESIQTTPYPGTGTPEALKYEQSGTGQEE